MRKALISMTLLSLMLFAGLGMSSLQTTAFKPSRYLYVWAGTADHSAGHHATGASVIAVFDADPASEKYGSLITAVTVDSAGSMPHHTEFSPPGNETSFFANDFGADKSFVIDFSTPVKPRVAGRTATVPGARTMHSFARLPSGNVLATLQFGDRKVEGDPGAIAEFDKSGKLVRSSSSADAKFPSGKIRTYGLTALPKIDRAVTTSSPMGPEEPEHVVQVWRLSNLELLETLRVPAVAGDTAHKYPFELRTMSDGETVLLNSYMCGLYRISGLASTPKIERLLALPDVGCSVPAISGKFMVMPMAYSHRVATFDISNPGKIVEVSSIRTDSTFFPHWASMDPASDRIVMTDQGDGPPRIIVGVLDQATGKITLDEKFRDPGSDKPGINFENVSWPNGVKGKVTPHGALFIR
jgi:hypothetical protein